MDIRTISGLVLLATTSSLGAAACVESDTEPTAEIDSAVGPPAGKPELVVPGLSVVVATQTTIDVQLCAGNTGAPAGFSLQWMTAAAHGVSGWNDADPDYCSAGFSGSPPLSTFSLDPGECTTLTIGNLDPALVGLSFAEGCNDPLTCDTIYVFRAFAHASSEYKKSPFTADVVGTTMSCNEGCTCSHGYWKTHDGAPNPNVWPVSSLTLGKTAYSQGKLSSILDQPPKGNGLVSLAHQLIAAKLNIASGASAAAISSTVASADALIGSLLVPPAGNGSLAPADTGTLTSALASYNEGTTGPGHCE